MKVLMLSWEYPPHSVGGLGKHVTELVPALARAGVEVELLTPRWAGGAEEEVVHERARVRRVDPPPVEMPDFVTGASLTNGALEQAARPLLERGDVDLIHGHDWLVAFAGVGLKHAFRLPLLATVHATE